MSSMEWIMFTIGICVGVIFATICLIFAAWYDDYLSKDAKEKRNKNER